MSGAITWEQIAFFLGLVIAGVAMWARVEQRINAAAELARSVRDECKQLELRVARDYASISYLKDVEERLVGAIKDLNRSINDMPTRVAAIMRAGIDD